MLDFNAKAWTQFNLLIIINNITEVIKLFSTCK